MDRPLARFVLFVAVVVLVAGVVGVDAGGEYSLSVSDSVSVPAHSVTIDGTTFEISSVGSVNPGDEIGISAAGPAGESYQLQLRDNNRNIVDAKQHLEGSVTESFTAPSAPGTYAVAIHDSTFKSVVPVVVNAYDVSVDQPGEIEQGESATIVAQGIDTGEDVRLIVWDGSGQVEYTMHEVGGSYERTVDDLDEGSYQLYVTVRGSDTIDGSSEREILALSDSSTLTVSEPAEESDDNGGSTSPPPSSPPQTATPTPTPVDKTNETTPVNETTTPVDETNETETPVNGTNDTATPTAEPTPTVTAEEPATPTETATATPTAETPTATPDDTVITPAPETPTPTVTDGQALYGMHLLALILALVGVGYRLRRW